MNVAIIGGGLAGLTAAYRLSQTGHRVTLFEKEGAVGGVIRTERVAGYLHEFAAASFLGTPGDSDGMAGLCQELRVETLLASAAARDRFVFVDGRLHKVPRGPADLLKTDLLTWRGKLALLREPFVPPAPNDPAADESVHAFATRRFGPEAARVLVAPMVTGVFAGDAHAVSVKAGFAKLAEMDEHGGVVRSMLRRRGKFPKLMTARGGMGSVTDALHDKLGAAIRSSTVVERMVATRDAVRIWSRGQGGATVDEFFDAVIAAVPAKQLAALVAEQPELTQQLRGLERAPVAVVCVGVPRELVEHQLHAFGVVIAQGEKPRVLGVVFESTVWPDRAPHGHVLLRCIYGGARDPNIMSLGDEELVAQAAADLSAVLARTIVIAHSRVIRWPAGIAQYAVGHRHRVARLAAACAHQRIVLAGSDYWGVGVNDVVLGASRAAATVAALPTT